jgi:lipoprotein-anchoring transpeptidase ErfK/SrfK
MSIKTLLLLLIVLGVIPAAGLLFFFNKEKLYILATRQQGYDNSQQVAVFHGKAVKVPLEISSTDLAYTNPFEKFSPENLDKIENTEDPKSDVLASKSSEKRIEVDLSKQKLYALEGSKKKMSFDVSTGKWGRTPTGEFRIWNKLKYTLMAGGSKELGTYYYLPNVPFTLFFYQGYGIHGTYWHDNFGHPMSHGCINMRTSEAEKLFYWANPPLPKGVNSILASADNKGTRVVIYGTAPNN